MIAVFYDRKNNRTVRSDQLFKIDLTSAYLALEQGTPGTVWAGRKKHPAVITEEKIADLGYKSNSCPSSQNWDLYTSLNDLVFLRLEVK